MSTSDDALPGDLPGLDPAVVSALRGGLVARDRGDEERWRAQLQLLTAVDDVSVRRRRPALAARAHAPRTGLPELRLLALTRWERWLPGVRVVLAGRGPALYVVWTGPELPEAPAVRLGSHELRLTPVTAPGRVLLDPRLDPQAGERQAWRAQDVDARDLLVPGVRVHLDPGDGWERRLPPLELRAEHLEGEAPPAEGELPPSSVQRLLVQAIRAYTAEDPATFQRCAQTLLRDGRGGGARRLFRWQSLWMGAMLAELERLPEAARHAWTNGGE